MIDGIYIHNIDKNRFEYTKHEALKKDYIENVSKMGSKCIKATLYTASQSEHIGCIYKYKVLTIGCINKQIASISPFLKWWPRMDVVHCIDVNQRLQIFVPAGV